MLVTKIDKPIGEILWKCYYIVKEMKENMINIFLVLKKIVHQIVSKNRTKYFPEPETFIKTYGRDEFRNTIRIDIKSTKEYYNGYGIQDERKISL